MIEKIIELASKGLFWRQIQSELAKLGMEASVSQIKEVIKSNRDKLPAEVMEKRRHKSTKTSPEKINKIHEMRKKEVGTKEIAKEVGLSERSVHRILANPENYPYVSKGQILELFSQGYSTKNIASKLKVDISIVEINLPLYFDEE